MTLDPWVPGSSPGGARKNEPLRAGSGFSSSVLLLKFLIRALSSGETKLTNQLSLVTMSSIVRNVPFDAD